MKKIKNPMNDLPMPIKEIIEGVDAVIVTHTHGDHWDEDAAKNIPLNIPIFVQNNFDKNIIQSQGFKDVRIVDIDTPFKGITITKNEGKHGTDDVLDISKKDSKYVWDFSYEHQKKKLFILLEIQFGQKTLKSLLKNMNLIIL